MFCLLILILLPSLNALACPNLYDYTADTVRCSAACPPNSKLKDNKCLLSNHYTIGQSVYNCDRGWVDALNTVCCRKQQFIITVNNIPSCTKCNTRVYGRGKLCCPGSAYADLTNADNPVCTPLGTGQCSNLTMKSMFQVCCPSGLMYSIQQQKCVSPANYNCGNTDKICCPSTQKLQYIRRQYICVQNCNWASQDNFYCRRKECNDYDKVMQSGPLSSQIPISSLKLSFSTCCIGQSANKICITEPTQCFKRFVNRGWSVCCNAGQFYIMSTNSCNSTCAGIILLDFFCMTLQTNILNLQSPSGQPSEQPKGSLCNGKTVKQLYPLCCPPGMYINDTNGCQLCNGRIFSQTTNQICCGFEQIYNSMTGKCQHCEGTTNLQGTLCCPAPSYISYSASGVSSCVSTCAEDNMYKISYCCQSLGNSQCSSRYNPTICNPSYLIPSSCQACPNFCTLQSSLSQLCTANAIDQCLKQCEVGTTYSPELQQCLSCDQSCLSCSQPFDSQYCNECKDGFARTAGGCSRCAAECLTCSSFVNNCLSCPINSSKPIYFSNTCVSACEAGRYTDPIDKSCKFCSSSCVQCLGFSDNQCSKCKQSFYLTSNTQGSCRSCASGCTNCYGSSTICYQCQPLSYLQSSQCLTTACQDGYASYYEPSLNHYICMQCHPNCNTCQKQVSNCKSCKNSSYFMSSQTGLNLCVMCTSPCLTCSSVSICTSCNPGFFLSAQTCIRCHSSCESCINSTQLGCTSCLGESQLVSGKCVGCSSMCQTCDQSQNCIKCKSQYLMYNGTCLNVCPTYAYTQLQSMKCIECPGNCSTCSDATTCTSCSATHPYLLNSQCLANCPLKYYVVTNICTAEIETNNTTPNTTDNNSTPNNNNTSNNNSTNNVIQSQTIDISTQSKNMTVVTTLKSLVTSDTYLDFYLIDKVTNKKTQLQATRVDLTQSNKVKQSSTNNVTYNVNIPDGVSMKNSILYTSVRGSSNSSDFFNSKSMFDFIFYDYVTDPLKGLQYVGLSFTILIIIFSIITKLKGHFIAEQANTIILHMLNFIQAVYLFKYTQLHTEGMYHFLNGFGFMHFLMFPNFFYAAIPSGYAEYPAQKSLIPDGNFIRNAGSSISFLLIVLLVMSIASIASFAVFKAKKLGQMPQIRKITRLGFLGTHVTYLNILFTGACYLIQPFMSKDSGFANSSKIGSIIMIIIIVLCCAAVIYHFYKTYNSDVLEHYYTIRQGIHYLQIICQAFIFTFGVGKPLICLSLIGLQIAWFVVNFLLYKYGQGDNINHHVKFIVSSSCIIVAYLMLSLSGSVHWIAIVVIVSIVVFILIVYSIYQIVGLYYTLFFKSKVKIQSDAQTNDKKIKQNQQTGTQF